MLILFAFITTSPLPADDTSDDIKRTAALIDQHIFDRLIEEAITPAPPSSDTEFLRRVWLDIAGKIPPASRARQFLADTDTNKRTQAVGELLDSAGYVNHFTTYWRNVLMPEVKSDEQVQRLLPGFDAWLRKHLAKNTPYDDLVREIITTPLDSKGRNQQMVRRGAEQSSIAFFQAKQIAPENLAAATSRIFLGIRIECAQCHDHPFDNWTQKQFWGYASFFAGIERQGDDGIFGRVEEVFDRREMLIPDSEIVVQASYLDGKEPRWRRNVSARQELAAWTTSSENPYFARVVVNRIWGKFFGVGLVDPVDDFTENNACSHPELLRPLSAKLIERDFDIKFLIQAITSSRAYQLSSAGSKKKETDPQLFASMAVKGLSPEQLFDSLAEATGFFEPFTVRQPNDNNNRMTARSEILELFANDTDPTTMQQTSILQALALMNGQFTASAMNLQQSRTLAAVINFPMTTEQRVESLFFVTLSRPPTPEERQPFVDYVKTGGATKNQSQALADVFWALLNSSEFSTNH
jgi:hypothetical protein